MTKNLHEIIDSDHAAKLFLELYRDCEVDSARLRYKKLITDIFFKDDSNEFNTSGNFRIFSSPGRTELAGNHTDHNRGKILAASIQLDNVAVVQERDDNTVFFRSEGFHDVKVKLTDSRGAPDLEPKPEEEGTTEAIVRGIVCELYKRAGKTDKRILNGFSANAASTVLPGSGLSSSAALESLLVRVFDSLYGEGKLKSLEIAQIGQIAENVHFGKPCGLMDQIACATGGAVAVNFANANMPEIKQINFDPATLGYALCVVNTGGSHASLTADYASIPAEMKSVAAFFGKSVLGEMEKETVMSNAAEIRKSFGDRALLRALHFFNENARVDAMISALTKMGNTDSSAFNFYLDMVNESGDSSWELLQNVYSPQRPAEQGIGAALALTKDFFNGQKIRGACRVHGGGFAGTIQVYIPVDLLDKYTKNIEAVFGESSVTILKIRPLGAVELEF